MLEDTIKMLTFKKFIKESKMGRELAGSIGSAVDKPSKEREDKAIKTFASIQHDNWRKSFDPEDTGKERIKDNPDGSKGNINVPFDKLHPHWQKENLSAGRAALDAIHKHGNDLEAAAKHVHDEWMSRNTKQDYNKHQHVPYSDLPEPEKEKDREHVRTMRNLL